MHVKYLQFPVYQVDAFTREVFRGNPAGVVPHADGLTESQMQDIARELNNSETAFILKPTSTDHDVWVRFFTPYTEVPICGHATISAHYVRAIIEKLPACRVLQRTGAGILPVDIVPDNKDYKIIMTQGKIRFGPLLENNHIQTLIHALNLNSKDIDDRCPVQVVSTGHGKIMIGIKRKEQLDALAPDMGILNRLGKEIDCPGFYVFTLDSPIPEILIHGRMFAPGIGINEDPVTGNANGPLGAYLVKHRLVKHNGTYFQFRARQGEAIRRPGEMEVMVDIENNEPSHIRIAGEAVIVFSTSITPARP
jgi:PhzF family phenazine biosynthesis protein